MSKESAIHPLKMRRIHEEMGIGPQFGYVGMKVTPYSALPAICEPLAYRGPLPGGCIANGAEVAQHVTLIYGLMKSGHEMKPYVDMTLEGWSCDTVDIGGFEVFQGDGYDCVVGVLFGRSANLCSEANKRLSRLPHVNTQNQYIPHVTVGYFLPDTGRYIAEDMRVNLLKDKGRGACGETLLATGIDYGDMPTLVGGGEEVQDK